MTTQNDGSVHSGDSAPALAALYAAERTDVQNILGHALTLISIIMAYSAIIGATWATKPDTMPHHLIPVIPIPLLVATACS
jgi:peptidoglycan/LPS O-acetylase OafA/YrhL